MTPEQIDNLSGPDLDRAVAKALGLEVGEVSIHGEYDNRTSNITFLTDTGQKFRPSADWNDAMLAAEKARLFQGKRREPEPDKPGCESISYTFPYLQQTGPNHFCVMLWKWESGTPYGFAVATKEHSSTAWLADGTGPTAICRAILKLAQ